MFNQTDSAILTYKSVTSYNKILAKCFLSWDKAITTAMSVYFEFLKMSITNFSRKKVFLKLSHSGEGWEELLVQLTSSKSPCRLQFLHFCLGAVVILRTIFDNFKLQIDDVTRQNY